MTVSVFGLHGMHEGGQRKTDMAMCLSVGGGELGDKVRVGVAVLVEEDLVGEVRVEVDLGVPVLGRVAGNLVDEDLGVSRSLGSRGRA